ncbi:hypothetical protein B0H34DRAFT_794302 [Crassisporium funariophilum]|nr:hypothetical protein B0H34DRAFT_794302 [Crassisporium funariophilum]
MFAFSRILFVAYLCQILRVRALHNVTVDDNDPTIVYAPDGSWSETDFDLMNLGGRHMVTSDPAATATFVFTGVAIYFFSPLWPFRVTTAISLDGVAPTLIILTDDSVPPDDDGPETVPSHVVWSAQNLENIEHTLVMSVGPGEDLAVVDTLMYSVLDPDDPTTSSITTLPPSTPTSDPSSTNTSAPPTTSQPTSTAAPVNASSDASKKGLATALGIVVTVFGLLVLGAVYWWWRRRQRRLEEEDDYVPTTNENDEGSPEMGDNSASNPFVSVPYRTRATDGAAAAALAAAAAAAASGSRRKGPAVKPRHPVGIAAKAKSPLRTIPEAPRREDREASRLSSVVPYPQDGARENENDQTNNASWTHPQPVTFVSIT